MADSTTEVEYVAASEVVKEVVWLKKFLIDLQVISGADQPITFYYDNSEVVAQFKEPRYKRKHKHIERKYHLIRDIIHRGDTMITKIASKVNLVDPFTNSLLERVFERRVNSMGLMRIQDLL